MFLGSGIALPSEWTNLNSDKRKIIFGFLSFPGNEHRKYIKYQSNVAKCRATCN